MKKLILLSGICAFGLTALAAQPRWQDRSLSDRERISALIDAMTVDEKVQMMHGAGVERLGVRSPGSAEAIHGVVLGGPARAANPAYTKQPTTGFPQGYGLGETWDRELLYKIGEQMGVETRAIFQNPNSRVRTGLVLWAPNADIGRDPRWGRTEECYGEDPYLVGALAASMVKGLHGSDSTYWRAESLMKHFLANSNETERTQSSSNFSDDLWREYYSYGFRKGFEAGSSSYMAAYNRYNGVPCTVHPMLKEIVAEEWGVDGIVSTDGGAFSQLITTHHYFDSLPQAAAACVLNGVNHFLDRAAPAIKAALAAGSITEADIDRALYGKIMVMLRLGLLDNPLDSPNPYKNIGITEQLEPWNTDQARALARRAADESVVLLKNKRNLLPLSSEKIRKIAVVGNRADTVFVDWYGGLAPYMVSPLQAIRNYAESRGIEVRYVADDRSGFAAEAARWADVVIAVVGNHPVMSTDYEVAPPWGKGSNQSEGREALDRRSLQLDTEDLIRVVRKYNPNTVVTLISSFPYSINWTNDNVDAIVHCAQSGQELGNALVDVIFGEYNPAGRLTQTWPADIADLPDLMDYDITNGRTYMYSTATPLYPFGHGLSYSKFRYSGLKVRHSADKLEVTFDVTNTSSRSGDEVAQVYVTIPGDKASKRLKGFARKNIPAGSTEHFSIDIPVRDLYRWNSGSSSWQLAPGKYNIKVGPSSATLPLSASVSLK